MPSRAFFVFQSASHPPVSSAHRWGLNALTGIFCFLRPVFVLENFSNMVSMPSRAFFVFQLRRRLCVVDRSGRSQCPPRAFFVFQSGNVSPQEVESVVVSMPSRAFLFFNRRCRNFMQRTRAASLNALTGIFCFSIALTVVKCLSSPPFLPYMVVKPPSERLTIPQNPLPLSDSSPQICPYHRSSICPYLHPSTPSNSREAAKTCHTPSPSRISNLQYPISNIQIHTTITSFHLRQLARLRRLHARGASRAQKIKPHMIFSRADNLS